MTRVGPRVLDNGEPFPALTMETVAHGRLSLPEAFADGWGVLLVYRAHWWPYCKQQLAAFEKARPKLEEESIRVIAASTDPLDKATETVKEHALGFPVGYALPVKETAAMLGAFYEEKRGFLQATGFVVKPDRTIAVSQFSSGPIGRLVWQDVLGLVQFYKKQTK
jgi:peroxiredoxin